MTAILTFVGWHDSGKTTLATQVVSHLKAFGYKVAVIKSSDETGILFDTPGIDTYKHREAGADSTLFVAPDQMVLQTRNANLSLTALAHRYFPEVDIVIGEGFKEESWVSKIEVVSNPSRMLRNEVHGVIAVATNLDIEGNSVFRLNQAEEIAAFIRKRFLQEREIRMAKVSVLVNGNKVPLKKFDQEELAGTVNRVVRSLNFLENATEIELRVW